MGFLRISVNGKDIKVKNDWFQSAWDEFGDTILIPIKKKR